MYGVWNSITEKFVYGIKAETKEEAERALREIAGKGSYCWRYTVKPIPDGFVNPPNDRYENKKKRE